MMNTLIQDIQKTLKVRDLIHVVESEQVGNCIGKLDDNNIHSLAIFDNEGKNIIGLVDYVDIILYLLNVVHKKLENRVTPASENLLTDDFDLIIKRANEFHMNSILKSKLVNKSKRDPLYEVEDTRQLWYVCETFQLGLHRVVVKDEKGNRTMFTQSDVISWLSHDTEKKLGDLSHKTIGELKIGTNNILSVNENEIAIDAFYKMGDNLVSGLAVLNNDGEVVGNFSSSDIRGIRHFNFYNLLSSVKDYTSQIRKHNTEHKSDVVWVIESTPFSSLVKKFAERRVHRVYVVEPNTMKPISVITLTDVLAKIPTDHN